MSPGSLIASTALVILAALAPQSPRVAPARPQDQAKSSPMLEAARRRWERLSPEEKQRARAAYESYVKLSEEERHGLAERARRLQETRERVQREMAPETREKLGKMEPAKRRQVMDDMVEGEAREIGQRIRQRLPDNWLERLERATPEDRARFLEQFKVEQRERFGRIAIEQIGRRLQLPPDEIRRLQELPEQERAQSVLELRQRLSSEEAREFGLPPGIDAKEWERWQKLPPEEFFEQVQRYRHSRGLRPVGPGEPAGPPGMKPPWAEHVPPERREGMRRLHEAVGGRHQDVLDFADLPPAERDAKIRDRKRQRCLAAILEGRLLPADAIGDLSRRSDPEFFEVVRRLLRPPVPPGPPGGRPPPIPPGERPPPRRP